MLRFIKSFLHSDDGAVTVDWVVLTGCMIGLGIAMLVIVRAGTVALHRNLEASLTSTTLPDSPFVRGGTGTTPTTPTTPTAGGGGRQ